MALFSNNIENAKFPIYGKNIIKLKNIYIDPSVSATRLILWQNSRKNIIYDEDGSFSGSKAFIAFY